MEKIIVDPNLTNWAPLFLIISLAGLFLWLLLFGPVKNYCIICMRRNIK